MGLRGLVRDIAFKVHGVPATVTVPDGYPVETRVIWLSSRTDAVPGGTDFRRSEAIRRLAIRRDDAGELPRGTEVAVTEHLLEAPTLWVVDATEEVRSDHIRVVVKPAQES